MMEKTPKSHPEFNKDKAQWPLAYSLRPLKEGDPPRKFWDLSYYRGPRDKPAQILYSDSLSRSESIARIFLNEPVLGFDMEWRHPNYTTRIQDNVSLIQIACERRIALFHIALHPGKTTDEVIAPSLRQIIESPSIIKTGVHIVGADFKRLAVHLNLQPRGALELSQLHHLVVGNVSTQLFALSRQVEHHLGLPLHKGDVRTSDWTLPISEDQRVYAANDAYAGFMLFHCMNRKRLEMTPVPPLPELLEPKKKSLKTPQTSLAQPKPVSHETRDAFTIANPFVTPQPVESNAGRNEVKKEVVATRPPAREDSKVKEIAKETHIHTTLKPPQPYASTTLYKKLKSHRLEVSRAQDISAFIVASNKVLEALVQHRPANKSQLLKIHGIGKSKAKEYGDEWLRIIAEDLIENPNPPEQTRTPLQPTDPNRGTTTPRAPKHPIVDDENVNRKRVRITNVGRSKEIHIYEPTQNTGLSFQFADTHLDTSEAPEENG